VALGRVLPDTNVCTPIVLLDLVLRMDEVRLHQFLWSEDLLDELVRVWVRLGRSSEAALAICRQIRDAFPSGEVSRAEYEHLIETMPGTDASDHPHAAAAVVRAPSTILTANIRDFPPDRLTALGVTVVHPDGYLCGLAREEPQALVQVIMEMAEDRHKPAMTAQEVLDALSRAGVTEFAEQMRPLMSG
jgi:hypothetical protein